MQETAPTDFLDADFGHTRKVDERDRTLRSVLANRSALAFKEPVVLLQGQLDESQNTVLRQL